MENEFIARILPYFLVFTRILAFMSTAPIVGMSAFPAQAKAGFAGMCALAIAASFPAPVNIPLGGGDWLLYLGKEILIGVTLGYLTSLVVLAAQMAGSLLSIQVGFSFGQYIDPSAPLPAASWRPFSTSSPG